MDTRRPRTGNDRLQLADLAVPEGVGGLAGGLIGESTGERQFVKRTDPVGPQIVELPIGVGIALLHRVVGPHAHMNRDDIGLSVGEAVGRAGEMRGPAVAGEDMSRHVVAGPHLLQNLGIALGNRSELRVAVRARSGDGWHRDVMDHPALIPAALVVDDEQGGNVGEDIVEGARIVGIGRKPGFGLERNAHGADRG